MWSIPGEDEYWERVRERTEASQQTGTALVKESLSVDDEYEEIKEQYGYPVEDLNESDLCEIEQRFCSIDPETAMWDERRSCIVYEFYKEAG